MTKIIIIIFIIIIIIVARRIQYKLSIFVVTEYSLLKDLMEDLDVMENVCELLNKKQRTNRVKNWSHLGRRFNFKKEILDDFSASQEEIVCPTEALIQKLRGSHPNSTLEELILKMHLIDRDDALEVLDDYLQGE